MRCKGIDLFWIAQRFQKLFSIFVANIFAMEKLEKDVSVKNEQIVQLPKIYDERGNLSFIEGMNHVPFAIERTYWIYDVPGGEYRGGHAFREQEEFIVALSGSFDVVLHDGVEERRYHLDRSYRGVYVPRMMWRRLENFSTNSLCLVLSSTRYDETDYIRDFEEFVFLAGREKTFSLREKKNPIVLPPADSFRTNRLDACKVFPLPKVHDPAGNLTALNNGTDVPFDVKRVFYIYDIPAGTTRGAHAHREVYQFIVAASSSFDLTLDDGHETRVVHLDRPYYGLLVVPGVWCRLENFSSASVCMVLASDIYRKEDYIDDYDEFLALKRCK